MTDVIEFMIQHNIPLTNENWSLLRFWNHGLERFNEDEQAEIRTMVNSGLLVSKPFYRM